MTSNLGRDRGGLQGGKCRGDENERLHFFILGQRTTSGKREWLRLTEDACSVLNNKDDSDVVAFMQERPHHDGCSRLTLGEQVCERSPGPLISSEMASRLPRSNHVASSSRIRKLAQVDRGQGLDHGLDPMPPPSRAGHPNLQQPPHLDQVQLLLPLAAQHPLPSQHSPRDITSAPTPTSPKLHIRILAPAKPSNNTPRRRGILPPRMHIHPPPIVAPHHTPLRHPRPRPHQITSNSLYHPPPLHIHYHASTPFVPSLAFPPASTPHAP